ncbi:Jouberin [Quaeritorhiza haematococci]|nr:Jouberin [Quaeritorhiza haematococci]
MSANPKPSAKLAPLRPIGRPPPFPSTPTPPLPPTTSKTATSSSSSLNASPRASLSSASDIRSSKPSLATEIENNSAAVKKGELPSRSSAVTASSSSGSSKDQSKASVKVEQQLPPEQGGGVGENVSRSGSKSSSIPSGLTEVRGSSTSAQGGKIVIPMADGAVKENQTRRSNSSSIESLGSSIGSFTASSETSSPPSFSGVKQQASAATNISAISHPQQKEQQQQSASQLPSSHATAQAANAPTAEEKGTNQTKSGSRGSITNVKSGTSLRSASAPKSLTSVSTADRERRTDAEAFQSRKSAETITSLEQQDPNTPASARVAAKVSSPSIAKLPKFRPPPPPIETGSKSSMDSPRGIDSGIGLVSGTGERSISTKTPSDLNASISSTKQSQPVSLSPSKRTPSFPPPPPPVPETPALVGTVAAGSSQQQPSPPSSSSSAPPLSSPSKRTPAFPPPPPPLATAESQKQLPLSSSSTSAPPPLSPSKRTPLFSPPPPPVHTSAPTDVSPSVEPRPNTVGSEESPPSESLRNADSPLSSRTRSDEGTRRRRSLSSRRGSTNRGDDLTGSDRSGSSREKDRTVSAGQGLEGQSEVHMSPAVTTRALSVDPLGDTSGNRAGRKQEQEGEEGRRKMKRSKSRQEEEKKTNDEKREKRKDRKEKQKEQMEDNGSADHHHSHRSASTKRSKSRKRHEHHNQEEPEEPVNNVDNVEGERSLNTHDSSTRGSRSHSKSKSRHRSLSRKKKRAGAEDNDENQMGVQHTQGREVESSTQKFRAISPPKGAGATEGDDVVTEVSAESTDQPGPPKSLLFEHAGKQPADFTDHVLGVVVHSADALQADVHVLRPVVQVHFIDLETGQYIPKSNRSRRLATKASKKKGGEPVINRLDPVITKPYCLQSNKTLTPRWDEELVIEEDYLHAVGYSCENSKSIVEGKPASGNGAIVHHESSTCVMFEVMDFVRNPKTLAKGKTDGWYRIAWAFLKLVGGHNRSNTEQKVRLQLFKYPKAKTTFGPTIDGVPFVYQCWSASTGPRKGRKKYPATLHVTVRAIKRQQTIVPDLELSPDFEPGKMTYDELMEAYLAKKRLLDPYMKNLLTLTTPKMPKWRRSPGQRCKVPNKLMYRIDPGFKGAMCLSFSKNGMYLAVGCVTSSSSTAINGGRAHRGGSGEAYPVRVYEVLTGDRIASLEGHQDLVYDLSWSEDDEYLASASSDGSVRLWRFYPDGSVRLEATMQHPTYVYAVCLHPSWKANRLIVTGSYDGRIRIWKYTPHQGISADHRQSSLSDSNVFLGKGDVALVHTCTGHNHNVNTICFDRDGVHVFSGDGGGIIKVWNCHTPASISETDATAKAAGSKVDGLEHGSVPQETEPSLEKKEGNFECVKTVNTLQGIPITCLRIHPSNRKILVQMSNNILATLDTRIYRFLTGFYYQPGEGSSAAGGGSSSLSAESILEGGATKRQSSKDIISDLIFSRSSASIAPAAGPVGGGAISPLMASNQSPSSPPVSSASMLSGATAARMNEIAFVRSSFSPCGNYVWAGGGSGGAGAGSGWGGSDPNEGGSVVCWKCDTGEVVAVYSGRDLCFGGSSAAIVDVAYHPLDFMVAFCAFGNDQPVVLYTWDEKNKPLELQVGFLPLYFAPSIIGFS